MGHAHLPPLPMTRRWRELVALVRGGAGVAQVADATLHACERGFRDAPNDAGVVEALWLLMRLPLAARGDDFADELRRVGVQVPDAPDLYGIVVAVTESIDRRMPNNRGRTDLGEMAQMAAAEALTGYVGGRLRNLFDVAPEDVRDEFARRATAKQFGRFARGGMAGDVNGWWSAIENLPQIIERLRRVQIICRSAFDAIPCFDHEEGLIYCDPPYVHSTRVGGLDIYPAEMSDDEHRELARLLRRCKAKVVISGYPSPLYDELYKKWRKVSFNVANHVAKGEKKSRATECIWMNYLTGRVRGLSLHLRTHRCRSPDRCNAYGRV